MAAALKLISHKLCPYVQRAVIALTEKGVPFERIDIDLANKPDWFLKISPLGKVPVLLVETGGRRGGVVREQRHLRIHRGHARRRKTASAGSATARAAPRLDGVRLDHSERTLGPGDDGRSRVFETKRKAVAAKFARSRKRWVRVRSLRARISAWWTRCSRRSSAISTCSIGSPIYRCSPIRRRCVRGERRWRSGRACARRSEPTIRNCCATFWCAMTRIC